MNLRDPNISSPVPFVGRKKFLKKINSILKKLTQRGEKNGGVLFLTGNPGVGRTRFLAELIGLAAAKGIESREFSAKDDALRIFLAQGVGKEAAEWQSLTDSWKNEILGRKGNQPWILIFSDLHELSPSNRKGFSSWLSGILSISASLLVVLEYRSGEGTFDLEFPPSRKYRIELTPLSKKEVGSWLWEFFPKQPLPAKLEQTFWERTRGNAQALMDWSYFIRQRIEGGAGELPRELPRDQEALFREIYRELPFQEKTVLKILFLHDTWADTAWLARVAGLDVKDLRALMEKWRHQGWVRGWGDPPNFWRLADKALARIGIQEEDPEEIKKLHGRIYDRLKEEKELGSLIQWLAYHASEAELSIPAYRWNLKVAEDFEGKGEAESALPFLHRALRFADGDFKKAYVLGKIGVDLILLDRFGEAEQSLGQALLWAERADWPEFVEEFNLQLAQLLSHVGRYREAESYYVKSLEILQQEKKLRDWLIQFQNLGVAFTEQAKYGEALAVFEKCLKAYREDGDDFGEAMVRIHLFQVHNAIGMAEAAGEHLEMVKKFLERKKITFLVPYLKLLEGKFEYTQGQRAKALRIYEEAARGFEEIGDINGKVEVLLSMSAPLLEHNLVKEAEKIIQLLSYWPELKKFPALEHSVHLRRLAIGAFSGTWVRSDIAMVSQDAFSIGRMEDWLQFWFHLALAGQKIGNRDFFKIFIQKARAIADNIGARLEENQRNSFLRRPDIARIFRLSEEAPKGTEATVRAKRDITMEGPAEPATLAPPVGNKKSE